MARRKIIKIDEEKCNGCGLCVPNCPEGALQIIDGKARLISDLFCDGLGACIGHCPQGAISIEEREAEPYDERKVMENIIRQGPNVIKAHLLHLKEHGEIEYLHQALEILKEKGIPVPLENINGSLHTIHHGHGGCPGTKIVDFSSEQTVVEEGQRVSHLTQWPVQLHLISPLAPYFRGKDLIVCADCVAYALGDFHKDWLKGKSIVIGCPKLDYGTEVYVEKITSLIDDAKVNTIIVMIMEVPCCMGLLQMVLEAAKKAKRKVPIKKVVVSIRGQILSEEWVNTV